MTESPAVECYDLCKSFGGVRAVNAVSLALARGQFMALLGPSGCGKTTVLRLIAGLERPDAGQVRINGEVMSDGAAIVPPNRRRVGMVFQSYALFPHMTVAQNVGYGLPGGDGRARRVAEMLELVGLRGLDERHPAELSGGQQQRVALARALAPQPDILLLDEPFSNLDVALRSQVREDVQRILKQAGVSAILVTHDQDEAMSMADCMGVMFDGAIVQTGAPRALYDDPATRRVAEFLGEANALPGEARGDVAATALGDLALRRPARGAVDVLIRAEQIALAGPGQGVPAAVTRVMYYGTHQHVWAALDEGATVKARCAPDARWRAGERVALRVSGPVAAFPAGESAPP